MSLPSGDTCARPPTPSMRRAAIVRLAVALGVAVIAEVADAAGDVLGAFDGATAGAEHDAASTAMTARIGDLMRTSSFPHFGRESDSAALTRTRRCQTFTTESASVS
jgi:hypothetical protein